MKFEQILAELNDVQRQAVLYKEGPSLIIAGAGSGKTRVLTTRIAYLVNQGVNPFNILALTFTNKAAREMRERIEKMVGTEARSIWMGTFHSVFARILRAEHHKMGYPANFTIYDTDDSKSVIKSILDEEKLDNKLYKPSYVHQRISAAKNNFIMPETYLSDPELMSEDKATGRPKLGFIYSRYTRKCFKSGAMDFDDLLVKTFQLLDQYPDVLNKYQQHFKYLLIDEFQDTNVVQYLIVKKLAASSRNITVVGDDSQSIYSFRGANIKNILGFENDYPELKIFKLEQNYRSTKTIVEASGCVIQRNVAQLKKKLWTSNTSGNKLKLIQAISESDEGNRVARLILHEKSNYACSNRDFVILYRTNAQSRSFEEALRRAGIDYRIVGSLSFYQRREIKDLLAYFRLVVNPKDEEALKRIINYPPRGIGDTTFARLLVLADDNTCSVWDIIENIGSFNLPSRAAYALQEFYTLIKSFMVVSAEKTAFDAAMHIAKASGILRLLYEDKSIEGIGRWENVQNLLSAIGEFSENADDGEKTLGLFLQEVSLLTDADMQDDSGDKVTLMTIHSAKGLEFPVVFITGLEENLFPSMLSMGSRDEIEEERRLFYVAMTRAMKQVYLSYARSRFRWGNMTYSEPSRFLSEIDMTLVEVEKEANIPEAASERPFTRKAFSLKNEIPKKKILPPRDGFVPGNVSMIQPGMEVEHERFGNGKVLQVEGTGENKKAVIYFHEVGQKQILLKFAKMRLIK